MKNAFLTAALFGIVLAASGFATPTTRYWDACKPSCGWNGNVGGSPNGVCTSCDYKGDKQSGEGGQSACSGGDSYTCMGQAPWAVNDNLAYGFAAAHSNGDCGKCYELTFNNTGVSGKKMIIMVSNIGNLQVGAAFDLMIPGGGTGDFNALSNQLTRNGVSNPNLGNTWGGFRQTCGANESCIRKMCDDNFGPSALADLKAGCYWFIDWFKMADNPNADHREVTCPQALIDAYKNGKGGGGGVPPIVDPPNPPDSGGAVVAKVEAETSTPTLSNCVEGNDNQSMCIGSGNGITNIGYIKNGDAATYTVNVPKSGTYTMEFRIALNESDVQSSSFTVTVNGQNVGTISSNGTGGWNTYQTVRLGSKVQFNQGSNTVVLNFGNSINVDYFQLIGEAEQVSVRYNAAKTQTKPRAAVTLTASPRGFTAAFPANHGYTAYKLVDLQGREVRSGKIGDGTSSLKFNNLKSSVLLLRLEGKNTSTVVKAITY